MRVRERKVRDDPEIEHLEGLQLPVISQLMVETAGCAGWWWRWDGAEVNGTIWYTDPEFRGIRPGDINSGQINFDST